MHLAGEPRAEEKEQSELEQASRDPKQLDKQVTVFHSFFWIFICGCMATDR